MFFLELEARAVIEKKITVSRIFWNLLNTTGVDITVLRQDLSVNSIRRKRK